MRPDWFLWADRGGISQWNDYLNYYYWPGKTLGIDWIFNVLLNLFSKDSLSQMHSGGCVEHAVATELYAALGRGHCPRMAKEHPRSVRIDNILMNKVGPPRPPILAASAVTK